MSTKTRRWRRCLRCPPKRLSHFCEADMADGKKTPKTGLTRRELFRSLGGGALVGGLVPAGALFRPLAPPPAGVDVLGPGQTTGPPPRKGPDRHPAVEP